MTGPSKCQLILYPEPLQASFWNVWLFFWHAWHSIFWVCYKLFDQFPFCFASWNHMWSCMVQDKFQTKKEVPQISDKKAWDLSLFWNHSGFVSIILLISFSEIALFHATLVQTWTWTTGLHGGLLFVTTHFLEHTATCR